MTSSDSSWRNDTIMRSIIGAALVAASMLCVAAPTEISSPYVVEPTNDGIETTSRYIESFDGTRLAITVHRPTRNGRLVEEPLPVVVTQARSDPPAFTLETIRYFTSRGYVWVAQDRRGTGASFGVQTGFVNELDAKDGKAVIEWAGAQPFSNGKVTAYGCSNQGAWQYVVLKYRPKYLVAIAPACASPQFFDHGISLNGIPMLPLAQKHYAGECNRPSSGARPAMGNSRRAEPERGPQPVDEDMDGKLLAAAIAEQRCGSGMMGQYWLNMPRDGYNTFAKNRPALDDTAMTEWRAIKNFVEQAGIHIVQIGGWFDAAVAGQFESQRLWGGRVIMGPWVHGNRMMPDAAFPNGTLDINAEILRSFDYAAKGIDNGANRLAALYYTINAPAGSEWRALPTWPPSDARKRKLYFTEQGLSERLPARDGKPVTYAQQDVKLFDGAYSPLRRYWSGNMSALDDKSLVHTLAPLSSDLETTGTPVARLWVSADARDENVFAILEDVAPDGRSTYVTDGRLRASWRKVHPAPWGNSMQTWHRGFEADLQPLEPGKPTELVFDFFPISYVFKKGHSIRVRLLTSIGEAYQAPPLAEGRPVTLTLYRDAKRSSAIELPVVEPR